MPLPDHPGSVSGSSAEMPAVDVDRLAQVERRHKLVTAILAAAECAGLLMRQRANIAWLTAGADLCGGAGCEPNAAIVVTPDARVVLTTNVDSQQIFDCQLPQMGFQLKERSWTETKQSLIDDMCRGRTMAADVPTPRQQDVSASLAEARLPLCEFDVARLRSLGQDLTHAVEATARHLSPGRSEAEIAGEVTHRLMKRGISAVRVQVAADGRTKLYRRWSWGDRPVRKFCALSAVGRRDGLHVGVTRTVTFGEPPEALWQEFSRLSLVHASAMYFSHEGWPLSDVWNRVQRIYEKFGGQDEWRNAEQGEVTGYAPCETPVLPKSGFVLRNGVPIHWHPSIGAAVAGDTVLVEHGQVERLTGANDNWPLLVVQVKGVGVNVPDILRLPETAGLRAVVNGLAGHGVSVAHATQPTPGRHGTNRLENGVSSSVSNGRTNGAPIGPTNGAVGVERRAEALRAEVPRASECALQSEDSLFHEDGDSVLNLLSDESQSVFSEASPSVLD